MDIIGAPVHVGSSWPQLFALVGTVAFLHCWKVKSYFINLIALS